MKSTLSALAFTGKKWSLLIVLCCMLISAQAQTVELGLSTRRSLPADWYGYDMSTTTRNNVSCASVDLKNHLPALKAKFLRFPSGSFANWYDWHQGWYVNSPYLPPWDASLTKIPNKLEDFKGLLNVNGGGAIIDLNMLTSNIRDQIAMLKHADSIGIPIDHIELGEEFYLEGDDEDTSLVLGNYPTPESYGDTASRWIDSLRKYFPNSKIAAQGVFEKNKDPRRSAWNDAVIPKLNGKQDAMTFHYYYAAAYGDTTETDSQKLDFNATDLPDMFYQPYKAWGILHDKSLAKLPAGKEAWITEYNLSDHNRPVHGSWASGIYTALHTMQLLQDDRITKITLHGVDGQAVFGAYFFSTTGYLFGLDPDAHYVGPANPPTTELWGLNAYGHTMTMMGNALDGKTYASRIEFSPNPQVTCVETGKSIDYNGLFGFLFNNASTSQAIIVNVTGTTQSIKTNIMFPSGGTYEMRYAPPLSLIATASNVTVVNATLPQTLVMQPYSIVRISANTIPAAPPTVSITPSKSTTICSGDSVDLDAGPNYYAYTWSTGATTRTIRVKTTGDYWVHAYAVQGGYYATAQVHVTVNPVPKKANIVPIGNKKFCQGGSVGFALSSNTVFSNVTYYWPHTGETTPAITASTAGGHYVIVTDSNGCSTPSDTEFVTVNPLPQPIITPVGPTSACYDVDVTLAATPGFTTYLWSNGGFGQTKVFGVSGPYSVTATDTNGCQGTSPSVNITIWEPPYPTVTASGPTTYCKEAGVYLTTLAGYQYQWYKFTAVLPGETNKNYAPTVTANYKVEIKDSHGCTKQSDPFVVTVNSLSAPSITVTGGTTICQGATTTLNEATGFSSYQWSTGQTTSSISVGASGTYSVTITDANGCVATSAPKVITVNSLPTPVITPQGPTSFCSGGSVVLGTGTYNSYNWSIVGGSQQTKTMTASGNYTVTVTDANGCQGTSPPVTVTVWNPPTPTIAPNGPTTFCLETPTTLSTLAGYSYQWIRNSVNLTGATSQTYVPSQGGTYKVTIADVHGCTQTSPTLSITVNSANTPTITGSTAICQGSSTTLTASSGFSSYIWSTGQTSQAISVSSAGNFAVTATDANGCKATSINKSVTVNPLPAPVITAQGPTSFCDGGNVILDAGNYNNYSWSNNKSTQTVTITTGGTYSVTVTNSNGCVGTSAGVDVTIWAPPVPSVTTSVGATTFCSSANVYLSTQFSGYNYQWLKGNVAVTGATSQTLFPTSGGSYKVTMTDAHGCSKNSTALTITINNAATPTISGGLSICQGSSTTLTATAGYSAYQWSTGQTTSSIGVSASGNFSVTATDASGCKATSVVKTVTVNPLPTPVITPQGAASFCDGGSVILGAGTYNNYSWSNGKLTQTVTVTTGGPYTITVTDANGCQATSSPFNVTVWTPPTPTMYTSTGATAFCENTGVYLTTPFPGYSYQWQKSSVDIVGATAQNYIPTSGGSYKVIITDAHSCAKTSAAFSITVNSTPSPTVNGSSSVCQGSATTLSTGTFTSYAWSNGPTTPSINVNSAGNYSVTVTDANGCVGTSAAKAVTVNPLPSPTITAQSAVSFCDGGTVVLDAGAGYANYNWSNGKITQTVSINSSGAYSVTVTNSNGCSATAAAMTVTEWIPPVPVLTTNTGSTTFCSNAGFFMTTSTTGYNYQWLKSGANIAGATNQNYFPTAGGSYKLTITDANGCSKTSAATSLTFNNLPAPVPTVTAQGPTSFCDGNSVVLQAGSGFTGYTWSNGITTQSASVTTSGSYYVTVIGTNGCAGSSAPIPVTVWTPPVPTITTSTGSNTYCAGSGYYLSTPVTGYNYQWQKTNVNISGATNQNYSPTATGAYKLVITDAHACTKSSATSNITLSTLPNPTPVITSPAGGSFCDGSTATLDAGSGYTSYSWTTGATTQTLPVTTPGTYGVTVTNSAGCTGTASTVSLGVWTVPVPSINTNTGAVMYCAGSNVYLTTPTTGYSYQWQKNSANISGATTQNYTPTTTGTYRLIISDAHSCSKTSSALNITINANPVPVITGASAFCTGTSTTLSGGSFNTYLWSNGQTTPTVNITAAGSYTVTVTDGNSCVGTSAAKIVSVNPLPTPVASGQTSTSFCEGGSVTLDAGSGYAAYSWSNGAATQTTSVNATGNYSVTVTNSNGCVGTSAPITVNAWLVPVPTITTSTGATTFCSNAGVVLTTSSGGFNYQWQKNNVNISGATNQNYTPTVNANYKLIMTDAHSCTKTSNIVAITINTSPAPVITGSSAFCAGSSTMLNVTGTYLTYQWSSGQNSSSINVNSGGNYTVTVTDANGCQGNVTKVMTMNPLPTPVVTSQTSMSFCEGGSVLLDAGSGFTNYSWSTGATTQTTSIANTGSYSVTVTNTNGCVGTSSPVAVTAYITPVPTIGTSTGSLTFCSNTGAYITTSFSGYNYQWQKNNVNIAGATSQTYFPTVSGGYKLVITDVHGCSKPSGTLDININNSPTPSISGVSAICQGSTAALSTGVYSSYLWSTGETTSGITAFSAGNYTVTVIDANGCPGTSAPKSVTVNPLPTPAISAMGGTSFCAGGSLLLDAGSGYTSYNWSNGSTSQTTLVTTGGSYSVTVTNVNGCVGTSVTQGVTVNPLPTASFTALGPLVFCAGGALELEATSGFNSYHWSNGATTQTAMITSSGTYSLTVTDANGCSATSGSVAVTVNSIPTPSISSGGPTTFCEGGHVVLNASAGYNQYMWSNGATTQSTDISSGGSYSVTVTGANGCTATSVLQTVTVYPSPVAIIVAQGPVEFCQGEQVLLNAGSGYNSYHWSNGATTQTAAITSAGTYSVTVTDANGCSGISETQSVSVNSLPTPIITAQGPVTICNGGSVVLDAGSGYFSYLWSNGATGQTALITTTGSYSVTVTSNLGCHGTSASQLVTATSITAPVITPQGPTIFCQGSHVLLNAGSGYDHYSWSNGATTQTTDVSAAGNYSVTITDANGCTATSAGQTITVNPSPHPVITAQSAAAFCYGGSVILDGGGGYDHYAWSNGATTQTVQISSGGNYSVTVTDGNGCSGSSLNQAVMVYDLPNVNITAGGPTTFCEGTHVQLDAGAGFSQYNWSNGATTQTVQISSEGNYSVTVTNAYGCTATSSLQSITVLPSPTVVISAQGPVEFCAGQHVTLDAGNNYNAYSWSNGATTQTTDVTSEGSYVVTVTGANGCSRTSEIQTVTVHALPAPAITAQGPVAICNGGSVILDAGSGYTSYLWSNGNATQTALITATGSYSVTVTSSYGCSGTSSVQEVTATTITAPVITAQGPTVFCQGEHVSLDAGSGYNHYSWSNGATTQIADVTSEGNYSVTVTDVNGCTATSASQPITVHPAPVPVISAQGAVEFCDGGSVQLDGGAGYSSYAWSNGTTSQTTVITTVGNYSVTVTDGNGCSGISNIQPVIVNALPAPVVAASGSPSFCAGGSVILDAGTFNQYTWSNGATTQTVQITSAGNYSVIVTDSKGCTGSSAVAAVTVWSPDVPSILTSTGSTAFCSNAGAYLSTAIAANSYQWQLSNGNIPGATMQNYIPAAPGNYQVITTDAHGCSAGSAPVSISINSNPAPSISGNTTFCQGASSQLSTGLYAAYIWSTGETTGSITVSTSGNYAVTVTDANGCTATTSKGVTVNPVPTPVITYNTSTTFCEGDGVILDAGPGYSSYSWSNGATTQAVTIIFTGTFNVNVTNAFGCSGMAAAVPTTKIILPNPVVTVVGPSAFCLGEGTYLTTLAGYSYQWVKGVVNVPGATDQNFVPVASSNYRVIITDSHGCTKTTNNAAGITVNALPNASISVTTTTNLCGGATVKITEATQSGNTYQWRKNGVNISGATATTFTASTAGDYTCFVTKTNGCTAVSNTITVTSNCKDQESAAFGENPRLILYPDPVQDELHVRLALNEQESGTFLLELRNTIGEVVYHDELNFIDHLVAADLRLDGALGAGVYFVVIKQDGKFYRDQFVISR